CVDDGAALVNASGATLERIVESVRGVGTLIGEIAAASTTQAERLGALSGGIGELDEVTRSNAHLVEETAGAGATLAERAGGLAGALDRFRV
ncbi:MAG: hypothetical protein RLW62_09215, partial [Gammaproteobacteria bacterium]